MRVADLAEAALLVVEIVPALLFLELFQLVPELGHRLGVESAQGHTGTVDGRGKILRGAARGAGGGRRVGAEKRCKQTEPKRPTHGRRFTHLPIRQLRPPPRACRLGGEAAFSHSPLIVRTTLVIGRSDSAVGMPATSLAACASYSGSVCTGAFGTSCTTL